MDDSESIWYIVGIISLFCLAFYFACAEIAIIAMPRNRVRKLLEDGNKKAQFLEKIMLNRAKVVNLLWLINSLILVFATSWTIYILTSLAVKIHIFLLIFAGVLVLFVFFGQMFPRRLVSNHYEKVSLLISPSLHVFVLFSMWMVNLTYTLSGYLARLFGKEEKKEKALSNEELRLLISLGKEVMEIEEEREMIESIFAFGDTMVKEIMVPRIDMSCVDIDTNIVKVLDQAIAYGYSRFPVYKETIDNIVGMVYTKDLLTLLKAGKMNIPLREIMRPAYYVPGSKKVDDLLRELQKEKISMAIVVDEYGGTDGLVTMEDIIEEIVGEITDEHDKESTPIETLEDGSILVDARMNIEDVNEKLDITLPFEEFETIGGYVYGHIGKVPLQGDKIDLDSLVIEVAKINRQRISKVKITKKGNQREQGGKNSKK